MACQAGPDRVLHQVIGNDGLGVSTYTSGSLQERADQDITHAHNEFLQTALDLGLPGLAALVTLYVVTFRLLGACWQAVKQGEQSVNRQGQPPRWCKPGPADIAFDPQTRLLQGSSSAFRREVWQNVGGCAIFLLTGLCRVTALACAVNRRRR